MSEGGMELGDGERNISTEKRAEIWIKISTLIEDPSSSG